jgi:hypothetical protein
MNIDSPFEQWRLKYMKGMAASRDIMELLALAFEGGRVAEREANAKLADDFERLEYEAVGDPRVPAFKSLIGEAIRARGSYERA